MNKKLDYCIKLWEKEKKEVINYYEEEERSIQKKIEYYSAEILKEDCDIIKEYNMLSNYYCRYSELKYVAKGSIIEYKKYFYLSAKAVELCNRLLKKGIDCDEDTKKEILNDKIDYAAAQAIIAGDNNLALQIVGEKSMIGCILLERYNEALEYRIPSDDDTYINQAFISIAKGDEEMLIKSIESRIRLVRKYAKLNVVMVDSYFVTILKLAKKRGMNCDIHVAEIPEDLLEDTPIDYENWQLPIPERVQKLLEE